MGFDPHEDSTNRDSSAAESWEPCPAGLLGQMTAKLTAQHRARRTKRRLALASVAASAVILIAVLSGPMRNLLRPGGISCWQCQRRFVAYHAHLSDGEVAGGQSALTDAEVQSMQEHLAGCWLCRRAFRNAYPGDLAAHLSIPSLQLGDAQPPLRAKPAEAKRLRPLIGVGEIN